MPVAKVNFIVISRQDQGNADDSEEIVVDLTDENISVISLFV